MTHAPQLLRRCPVMAIALACAAMLAPAQDDLTLDFKPLFPQVGSYPLLSGAVAQGAVTLEPDDFVTMAPSLRLDCSRTPDRVIGVGCYIRPEQLDAWRGKAVVFHIDLKWLEGSGRLTLQMRASGERVEGTIASQEVFEGERGAWVPFELHATIPPMPEVEIVNFMVWLENTQDPAVVLVDGCRLAAEAAAGPAERDSSFAAYGRAAENGPLDLVRDGRPVATIVLGEPATRCARFAAQELNEHLRRSTGAELPIVTDGAPVEGPTVQIGTTQLTERLGLAPRCFAPDRWTVQRVGDALILSGGEDPFDADPASRALAPFGSLYATYEFLERVVGVRWFWPGELGTDVPAHATVSVGNVAWYGEPAYETRFAFYAVPQDDDFDAQDTSLWWRRMRWGGVGGSPIGMHSFNRWPERFGAAHPDWFALQRNGQRAADDPGGYVCFSNPEVFAQTLADVRADLDARPETRYRTVMPGDGMFECMCPDCQAQADVEAPPSGRWSHLVWDFINRIAAEVRQSHPDRVITSCAYSEYREPPADVGLLPNIAVTLCTNYLPNVWKPGAKADYLDELGGWAAQTDSIYVWDYWYARRAAGTYGAPTIFPHALQEWFALERGRVKGRVIELSEVYADGRSSSDWADWMFDALNMYVAMRLMWDVDQDVEGLIAEYCERLYGPAAPLVGRFYAEMEAAWADPSTKGAPEPQWDWSTCWLSTYPPEFVARELGYLREAEKLTRGQEPYHARVAKTLAGFLPFEAAGQRYVGGATAAVRNREIVVRAAAAPVIDGRLDDACWEGAARAEGFFDMFNSPELRAQTFVRVTRDDANLYFAVRAPLPNGECKQTLPAQSRDRWVWEDESCELFLVEGKRKYQFLLGPGDIFGDNYHPDADQEFSMDMFAWNCAGARYATALGEAEWTAELAVPLAALELPAPAADAPWRVNFCRNHYYRLPGEERWQWETSAWRPAFGSFHNIERFGVMYFE